MSSKTVEISKPKVLPGQVLIEIQTGEINPIDGKTREGILKQFMPIKFPFILGSDFPEIIVATGEGVIKL